MNKESHEDQDPLDLGIVDPEQPDIEAVREQVSRAIGDAARARDEEDRTKDRPPLPEGATVQERLAHRLAGIKERDEATNEAVSLARREETSDTLRSSSANAAIDDLRERERQRLADQRAADAASEHDRDLVDRGRRAAQGRAKIAEQWAPPLTEGEKQIEEARKRGRQARGETDKDAEPDSEAGQ